MAFNDFFAKERTCILIIAITFSMYLRLPISKVKHPLKSLYGHGFCPVALATGRKPNPVCIRYIGIGGFKFA